MEASARFMEAGRYFEPQHGHFPSRSGTIVSPSRANLIALMAEAAERQQSGRDYEETLERLAELLHQRMVGMIYCEVAERLHARDPAMSRAYASAAADLDQLLDRNA